MEESAPEEAEWQRNSECCPQGCLAIYRESSSEPDVQRWTS